MPSYDPEALIGVPPIAGNRVTLLCDGPETLSAMSEAIRRAEDHIHLETFIFRDDEVGRPLAELLVEKRKEGVQVNVLYDGFDAMRKTPKSFFDWMRSNGVAATEFNPLRGRRPVGWGINNRDHRKILVVDGKIAFTGGINFYRVYSRSPSHPGGEKGPQLEHYWRDTHVRLEGPAVAEFQRLFLEMWRLQEGSAIQGGQYFPQLEEAGESFIRVIASTPERPRTIYEAYISAIRSATRSVHLTHAYLVLNQRMAKTLSDAAQSVDVKMILPGFGDFLPSFYAGRHNYSALLRAGVRIFQRKGALLHSKTAVVDGLWSTVGSCNLTSRSFNHDAEVNAVVLGEGFGSSMEAVFAEDLAASDEIVLEEWERRPFGERVRERFAHLFRYWL